MRLDDKVEDQLRREIQELSLAIIRATPETPVKDLRRRRERAYRNLEGHWKGLPILALVKWHQNGTGR
jgi:hypothetical protein